MRYLFMGFLFLTVCLQCLPAIGEYRVFLLKISKNPPATPVTPGAPPPEDKVFESTLDPEQYRTYYPVRPDEKISYTETWRCYGRTSGEIPFCPNPKRQPSSETNNQNPPSILASPP
ncbi:MAG: hypothetical protein AABY64_11490 [Bdellovibrionota bacterium]